MSPANPNDKDSLLDAPPTLGQAETLAAILTSSKRIGEAVPIRARFVQQGERGERSPGPLAGIVAARDEIGLDLLLLALAAASAPPHDVRRPTEVWLRALGRDPRSASSASAVSRAWRRLEQRQLVTRTRHGRLLGIELKREDGSGSPYTYPTGTSSDLYFKLPFVYWTDKLHSVLTLRGKAMLLIALSLADGFTLPYERVPTWYGLSADTAQRGLHELEDNGLLRIRVGYKAAPLTAQGWTEERRYTLDERLRVAPVRAKRQSLAAASKVAKKQPTPNREGERVQETKKSTRARRAKRRGSA